jgi:hypothetical protein
VAGLLVHISVKGENRTKNRSKIRRANGLDISPHLTRLLNLIVRSQLEIGLSLYHFSKLYTSAWIRVRLGRKTVEILTINKSKCGGCFPVWGFFPRTITQVKIEIDFNVSLFSIT